MRAFSLFLLLPGPTATGEHRKPAILPELASLGDLMHLLVTSAAPAAVFLLRFIMKICNMGRKESAPWPVRPLLLLPTARPTPTEPSTSRCDRDIEGARVSSGHSCLLETRGKAHKVTKPTRGGLPHLRMFRRILAR